MKKFGFTLAEVLITLGIIGVVAAMTIPTLIANTNSARFRAQYKKTLSALSQAGRLAQERYDYSYVNAKACKTETDTPFDNSFTLCGILNGTLTGHKLKFGLPENYAPEGETQSSAPTGMPDLENAAHVLLADGSMLVFDKSQGDGTGNCAVPIGQGPTHLDGTTYTKTMPDHCYAFIDVNGPKSPNREITCSDGHANSANCEVIADFEQGADIYPVAIHDSIVEPATSATREILQKAKKSN